MPRPVVPIFWRSRRPRGPGPGPGAAAGSGRRCRPGQKLGIDGHALLGDLLDLAQQVPGIDDNAIADDRRLALHHADWAAGPACRPCRPPPACGRRCGRPGTARRHRPGCDSQSTILPLPSSPHWAPTTATFAKTVSPHRCLYWAGAAYSGESPNVVPVGTFYLAGSSPAAVLKAHSSHGAAAITSAVSTVQPHHRRSPGGAFR
jgi:hypothetical protein